MDGRGRVRVKTNCGIPRPVAPDCRVAAVVHPLCGEILRDDKRVARHERCYGRGHEIFYLLEKKPGAMAGSPPLKQWR